MLPTRELQGTGIVTSALGFGCAGLFWIPQRSERRLVLDAAYDAGIRHFDVAPMYGLGLAEAELAPFLRQRRAEVTITTKFGIAPTLLARGVGTFQGPLRAFLATQPNAKTGLKKSGRDPHSGSFGRLLYYSSGYSRKSAQLSLERSLQSLKTDWIDVFLLHDPVGSLITEAPELVDYLDGQCRQGRIRSWGATGRPSELPELAKRLGKAPVIQYRDDIFEGLRPIGADLMPDRSSITYGALARALPILRRFLAQSPGTLGIWSERLGTDLAEEQSLPRMLLSIALWRNTVGPVLFTSTRADRGYTAAEAAIRSMTLTNAQAAAFNDLASEARLALPEMVRAS
jgi:D-threo-aldose 1-dehydrogenase